MSVTGTEILHGGYRNYNPNAAFCLRDPSFLLQLLQEDLPRYQDTGHKALFMQSLKEQVCHRFPEDQILHYGCQILATDSATGLEKVSKETTHSFFHLAIASTISGLGFQDKVATDYKKRVTINISLNVLVK